MRRLNKHPFDTIVDNVINSDAITIIGNIGSGKTFIAEKIKLKFAKEGYHIVTIDMHEDHIRGLGFEYISIKTLTNILFGRSKRKQSEKLVVIIDSTTWYTRELDKYGIIEQLADTYKELNVIPIFIYDVSRDGTLRDMIPAFNTLITLYQDNKQHVARLTFGDSNDEHVIKTNARMYS